MRKDLVLNMLAAYTTSDPEEQVFVQKTIDFVSEYDHFWSRSNIVGHLTGSAWVLSDEGTQALLIHHPKLLRWLQPGGHVEAEDTHLYETARREVLEECGAEALQLVSLGLFDLDIHPIPEKGEEPEHLHFDCRFLFKASGYSTERELKGIQWVDLTDLTLPSIPTSLKRMAVKSLVESNRHP